MKKAVLYIFILAFLGCTQTQLSHTETSKIVIESFYKQDNTKLKKHTTPESYTAFTSIQEMMTANEGDPSNFKIIEEKIDGDIAWVKFTTSYEEKPETFKLTKEGGKWKVMELELREESPF